jgi:hypothetical protein
MATTTKSKIQNKQAKNKETYNTLKKNSQKKRPTEEQIRQKAQEIYNQRIVSGEFGTALDDWYKAERILTED